MTAHPEAEVKAVTGRPNDTPIRDPEPAPLGGNSTFGSRRKRPAQAKAVDGADTENKAMKSGRAAKK